MLGYCFDSLFAEPLRHGPVREWAGFHPSCGDRCVTIRPSGRSVGRQRMVSRMIGNLDHLVATVHGIDTTLASYEGD